MDASTQGGPPTFAQTPVRLIGRLRGFAVALLSLNVVSLLFRGPSLGLLFAAWLWQWVAKVRSGFRAPATVLLKGSPPFLVLQGVTVGNKRAITVLRVWSCCGMVTGVAACLLFLALIFPFIGCACSSSCVELVYNEAQEQRLWALNHTGELEDWTRNTTGKSPSNFLPGRALSFVGTHALSWAAPLLHAADSWSRPPPPSFDQQLAEDAEDAYAEAIAATDCEGRVHCDGRGGSDVEGENSGGEWVTEEEDSESSTTVAHSGRGSTRTIFVLTWAPPPPSPHLDGEQQEGGTCPFHREHTHPLSPASRSHWNGGAPHWHHADHVHAPPPPFFSLFAPPPPPPFALLRQASLEEEQEAPPTFFLKNGPPFALSPPPPPPPPFSFFRQPLRFAPRPARFAPVEEAAEEGENVAPSLHAALLARFGRGRRLLSVTRSMKGEEGTALSPEERARKDAFADKHRPRPEHRGEEEEEGGDFKRTDPAVALAIRFVEELGNVTLASVQRKAERVCTVGGPLSAFGFVVTLVMLLIYRIGYIASTRLSKHPWVAQQARLVAAWQGAKASANLSGLPPPPPPPGLVMPAVPTTIVQRIIGVFPPPPPVTWAAPPSPGGSSGAEEVLYRFVPGSGFVAVGGGGQQEASAASSSAQQPTAVVVSPPPQGPAGYPAYPYAAYVAQGVPQGRQGEEEEGASWDLGLGSMVARSVRTAFARVPMPAFPASRGSYAPVPGRDEGGAGYEMQGLVAGHTRQPSRGAEPSMHAPSAPPAPAYAPGSAAAYGRY
jgi:hypothetical protein